MSGSHAIPNPNNLTIRQFLGDPGTPALHKAIMAIDLVESRRMSYPGFVW